MFLKGKKYVADVAQLVESVGSREGEYTISENRRYRFDTGRPRQFDRAPLIGGSCSTLNLNIVQFLSNSARC